MRRGSDRTILDFHRSERGSQALRPSTPSTDAASPHRRIVRRARWGARRGDRQTDAEAGRSGPLVAFDFDGTLTCRDSFRRLSPPGAPAPRGRRAGLLASAPALARYGRDHDRGALKAAMVRQFLRGVRRADLEADAGRYAAARSRGLLRPDALRAWRRWREPRRATGDRHRDAGDHRRALRARPGRRAPDRHPPGVRRRGSRDRRPRRRQLPRGRRRCAACARRSARM